MKKNRKIQGVSVIVFILILAAPFSSCTNLDDDSSGQKGPRKPLAEYTEDYAREWAPIAGEHIPEIQFVKKKGEEYIHIYVPLKDPSPAHYIEKIGIFDIDTKKDLAVAVFPRETTRFEIEFPYHYDDRSVKVFVKCNLHDLWTVDHLERFRK